jgi:hypothetical protein
MSFCAGCDAFSVAGSNIGGGDSPGAADLERSSTAAGLTAGPFPTSAVTMAAAKIGSARF